MSEKKHEIQPSSLSRREFLKDAGLVVGGAAIGSAALLSACSPKTTTVTQTNTTTTTFTPPAATVTVEPTSLTILNPEGQMEPIPLTPLAARVTGGLAGKTIYVVSVNFTGTEPFLEELTKLFKEKYPTANVVYKIKAGSYAAADQALWDEVKAKANAFVMAVGH